MSEGFVQSTKKKKGVQKYFQVELKQQIQDQKTAADIDSNTSLPVIKKLLFQNKFLVICILRSRSIRMQL